MLCRKFTNGLLYPETWSLRQPLPLHFSLFCVNEKHDFLCKGKQEANLDLPTKPQCVASDFPSTVCHVLIKYKWVHKFKNGVKNFALLINCTVNTQKRLRLNLLLPLVYIGKSVGFIMKFLLGVTVDCVLIFYKLQQFAVCALGGVGGWSCLHFFRCNFLAERPRGSLLWKSLRVSGVKPVFGCSRVLR